MKNKPRYVRATLIAPLAISPVLAGQVILISFIEFLTNESAAFQAQDIPQALFGFFIYLTFALVVAYVITAIVGVMTYAILHRLGKATATGCAIAGGLLGALAGGVFWMFPGFMILTALCGASVATAFSMIAKPLKGV